ncbi:hypothetical protein LLE49_20075 [Alicyclobacillus tolerans]|uniref:hypothetical protein n=1 Tax=Alicyclobacillus tolerans TaxID=90970 RepID=UPI001F248C43|nr:hypothetical protein [Alicyclobacillus tolerans]MCF8567022.1 hypothetical protein [Alicyclobacillus tolerans]
MNIGKQAYDMMTEFAIKKIGEEQFGIMHESNRILIHDNDELALIITLNDIMRMHPTVFDEVPFFRLIKIGMAEQLHLAAEAEREGK